LARVAAFVSASSNAVMPSTNTVSAGVGLGKLGLSSRDP
jgi:hypothetical protein